MDRQKGDTPDAFKDSLEELSRVADRLVDRLTFGEDEIDREDVLADLEDGVDVASDVESAAPAASTPAVAAEPQVAPPVPLARVEPVRPAARWAAFLVTAILLLGGGLWLLRALRGEPAVSETPSTRPPRPALQTPLPPVAGDVPAFITEPFDILTPEQIGGTVARWHYSAPRAVELAAMISPPPAREREPEPPVAAPTFDPQPVDPVPPTLVREAPPPPEIPPFRPARVLERIEPHYPPRAERRGEVGTVVLKVLVGEDGRVARVLVEQGLPGSELEAAAIDAVLGWKYDPAQEHGRPIRSWVTESFAFEGL